MANRRPRRLDGFDYTGFRVYFLTICTFRRLPAFVEAAEIVATLGELSATARVFGFEVIAYCFMPDHLHLLVRGIHESADLRRFVSLFKQLSGFAYTRRNGKRLWQEGYYEHVVRDERLVGPITAYILNNPLRAGLAASLGDYPHMGSSRYSLSDLVDMVQWMPPHLRR